jgi:FkbM family methyltransferase
MNDKENMPQFQDVNTLIGKVKSLVQNENISNLNQDVIREFSERLASFDVDILAALQSDREGAISSIKLLSQVDQRDAVFSLLANLEIPRDDSEFLEVSINVGLGGDAAVTHQWIVDYDIVGQRLEMIQTIVLPYIAANCPEKTLFHALKLYEANALSLNQPLINPQAIYDIISVARGGRVAEFSARGIVRSADRNDSVRLVLPNEIFNVLLRLAWTAQDYLFELHERYAPDELIRLLKTLEKVVPVYLIPTHLGYPMGGGESFMHQTCRILSEFAVKCVWVSFLDPKTGWYTQDSLTYTPYYIDVRYAGGMCREDMQRAIDIYCPDLVHAQGGTNDAAMEIAEQSRCTTMIGYHFWNGLIELGQTGNRHIVENLAGHSLRRSPAPQSALVWKYVASEFMQDVYARLGGSETLNIVHPISDNAQFLVKRGDFGTYVLQINVCTLKGGNIFLDSVQALGDKIPFMGIQGEPEHSDFSDRLTEEVERHDLCKLMSYGNVREFYQKARLVIVPTLVDETFCRVAFEAAMNGIPVLCTANGFLPSMFGDTGVYLSEDSAEWITAIRDLYYDVDRLRNIGEMQRARLQSMFGSDFHGFIHSAMRLIDNSATRNIGVFTVWGDQGLGNLAHTHTKLLRRVGYKVHIFSFQPYTAIGNALVRQTNPDDWSVPTNADSIYYSFNHREAVTVHELTQFILINNIHTLIVPEICWNTNWERLFDTQVQVTKLMICSIPMIEIVIREEISNHNRLTSTLYCTRSAEKVLNESGVNNGVFLGHGFGLPLTLTRVEAKRLRLAQRPKIRFLHVAGHNPKIRKNTNQVIEAFSQALTLRDDIELTVTSMDPVSTYYSGELPSGITIIDRCLSRDEILDLYEEHDVSIQVSSHEGLGLGFYESLCRSTPVLSLDSPPHNEIVLEGKTGWLIPARSTHVADNEKAVVEAWRFNTNDLTSRIVLLNQEAIDRVTLSTGAIYKTRFDEVALLTRFLQALPRGNACQLSNESAAVGGLVDVDVSNAYSAEVTMNEHVAEGPQESCGVIAPVPGSVKFLVKRVLFKTLRAVYQLTKPITRRIAFRLRLLMIEATDDLRHEIGKLNHDVQDIAKKQILMDHELAMLAEASDSQNWKTLGVASAVNALTRSSRSALEEARATRSALEEARATRSALEEARATGVAFEEARSTRAILEEIRREVEFIKHRTATYAGQGAVLTYLKDESPIFVNTGDLGCPSPIVNGGIWEPENLSVLYSFVTSNTVFLDIGANIGYFSIAIGNRLKRSGKVFAVEPHPTLTNLIERSVQLNSLEAVVQIFQCAVSDQEGALDLFYPDDHLGKGSSTRNADEQGRCLSVHAHRLDSLLPQDVVVDLIKIDVEGHELSVLRGMHEVLQRSPNVKVLFEKLDSSNTETDEIGRLMREHGLALYGVGPHALLVPLDIAGYQAWIGDVLAAPFDAIDRLLRTGFSIYPGQLSGTGWTDGALTTYTAEQAGVVFFGPDWYLRQGSWDIQLHGRISGAVRMVIVEEHQAIIAEFTMSDDNLKGNFTVTHNITHFEVRAYAEAGVVIDLERIEFQHA